MSSETPQRTIIIHFKDQSIPSDEVSQALSNTTSTTTPIPIPSESIYHANTLSAAKHPDLSLRRVWVSSIPNFSEGRRSCHLREYRASETQGQVQLDLVADRGVFEGTQMAWIYEGLGLDLDRVMDGEEVEDMRPNKLRRRSRHASLKATVEEVRDEDWGK